MNCQQRTAVAVLVVAGLLTLGSRAPGQPPASASEAGNALLNPSFEEASENGPAHWRPFTWRGDASFEYAGLSRTGKRSVMIASEKGADVAWHLQVPVQAFSTYRLSGWIRTEDVRPTSGRGALLNLHNIQGVATPAARGTRDWTQVEVVFETDDQDSLWVNCLFGGWGLATGKAWFDDLRLELLSSADLKPSITVDVARKGEPISKYIYGQFIEHLGRCIYSGIWAEMLEDRKFFYPVGDEMSPWGPLAESTVEMIAEDSFVGDHTPLIAAGGGIHQGGLGLAAGKQYVGRIWLKARRQPVTVQVSLVCDRGEAGRQVETITIEDVPQQYAKYPLKFRAGRTTDDGVLRVKVSGGTCFVGTVSLMPEDALHGMRADTLELLKELDAPVYRWPGGNFVSGYDWRDGIGDPDRRPPRKNPAWKGIEHNDFGIDEFVRFCRQIGTEPLVVVNSGQGDVKMAVEELQYANADPDTPMGKLRSENGHPEPYRVRWWGIGNEMYGRWQLGHMPLEQYVEKHNRFAEAMRAADPSIKLIAVGAVGPWSEGMMAHCADHMDLISEHFYVQERPGLISHVAQTRQRVRSIADAHRRYREQFDSLKGKDIRIALDEWNYWYGPHIYGELGVRYHLKDALGVGAALNEFARNTDMYFMANYAQTVNVIGAIKTSKTDAAFATTGLALVLYRKHFGVVPVATEAGGPLDAASALSEGGKTLCVAVVNPTMEPFDVPLEVRGAKLTGAGRLWQIAGSDPMAYNEPGKKPNVTIEEASLAGISSKLGVAPCSVSIYVLDLRLPAREGSF